MSDSNTQSHLTKTMIALACSLLLVIGCETLCEIAPPLQGSLLVVATDNGELVSQLQQGRHVYITTCVRCHSPEPIERYSERQWDSILPRMATLAELNSDDRDAVKAYVQFILQNEAVALKH